MPICLATGDAEPGGLPPVFTAICLIVSPTGFGTGFFVGERANVVTARHVVCKDEGEGATQDPPAKIMVCWVYTGASFLFRTLATVVRDHTRTDLALLRLHNPEEFPRPLSLDSLTSLSPVPARCGDFVYFDTFRHTRIKGFECCRVRARVKESSARSDGGLEQRILTLDAKAWPGASGSPLFSRSGEVIGVITAVRRDGGEAVARDVRWVWQLFDDGQLNTMPQPEATVIPFPPPPQPPLPDPPQPVPWWKHLGRFGADVLRQARTSSMHKKGQLTTLQLREPD